MQKVTHRSETLQYTPADYRDSDRESNRQARAARISDESANRPYVISYYPKVARLLRDVYAAIFLQQVHYRFRNNRNSPFYKFLAPCSSEYYRRGDSWVEELSFTYSQLTRAIRVVATKASSTRKNAGAYKTRSLSADQIKLDDDGRMLNSNALVTYWTQRDHRTWWTLNLPLFISLLQIESIPDPQIADQLIDESTISPIGNSIIRFPHAETTTIDKCKEAHQSHFQALENNSLQPAINPAQGDFRLDQYAQTIAEACKLTLNVCSTGMTEEVLSAARTLQAARHSLEEIVLVGHWWANHFWKGQRGTPPRPSDLLDMFGAAENFYTSGEGYDCCRVLIEQRRSTNALEAEGV